MSRSLTIEGEAIEVKQHAKLSPSGAKRWMACPGSIQLAEDLGIKDTTSKYAAEGTVAHEVGELCLLNKRHPEYYLGKEIEADGFKFTVNQNMVDAVEQYVDYINGRIEWGESNGYRVELQVEVKCSLKTLGISGLDGGTSDTVLLFWVYDNDMEEWELYSVEIADYKHGQGVAVEVVNNPQLQSYGLGALIQIGIDELDDVEVILTIVQPRAYHHDGRIRTTIVNSSELFEWQDTKLVPAALATQQEDAPLIPTEEGCRFCKAKPCKALDIYIQESTLIDFSDMEVPDIRLMTSEEKTQVMKHIDMIRSYLVSVEAQVKKEVDAGSKDYQHEFKLVTANTHRKLLPDYNDEFNMLMEYLDEEDLYVKKPVSIGDIEGILKAKLGKIPNKKLRVNEIMDEITIKPEGQLVIAPISDSRREVLPTVTSDFTDLDDL